MLWHRVWMHSKSVCRYPSFYYPQASAKTISLWITIIYKLSFLSHSLIIAVESLQVWLFFTVLKKNRLKRKQNTAFASWNLVSEVVACPETSTRKNKTNISKICLYRMQYLGTAVLVSALLWQQYSTTQTYWSRPTNQPTNWWLMHTILLAGV